jgi:hypothetical protein
LKTRRPDWLRSLRLGLLAMLLSGLAGCGTPGGGARPPLRLSNWWNFYESGREALRAGDLETARGHFERCLGLRAGARFEYPVDRWRARTYGFHFIDNYFPNRELGITLLLQGNAAGAVPLLEKSLQQEPSDRARQYLDRARAAVLVARPGLPPPVVRLHPAPAAVSSRAWPVGGAVANGETLASLTVAGQDVEWTRTTGEVTFSLPVKLAAGLNTIPVVVRDLLGREMQESLVIRRDTIGPVITAGKAARIPGGWRLEVTLHDVSGLRSVRQGEKEWLAPTEAGAARASWLMEVTPRSEALEAEDMAGNRTVWRFDQDLLRDLAGTIPPVHTAQADAIPAHPAPEPRVEDDRNKPVIRPAGVATTMVVHEPYFYLDGAVTDGGGLASVTVNGEEQLPRDQLACTSFRFATELQPDKGTNRVVIAATDRAGNSSEFVFTLAYFIPEYEAIEQRLRVAALPFALDKKQEHPEDRDQLISSLLSGGLLQAEEPRFRVLERDDETWDALLREQELNASNLTDNKTRFALAKILPADLFFAGQSFRDGKGETFYVQVVEVSTGRILFHEDVYTDDPERETERSLRALASKLERRFPLLLGSVIEVDGKSITLSLGKLNGVNAGARFLVIGPEGEPNWDEVKRVDGTPLEVVPSRISEKRTRAVIPTPASGKVKEGDRVYTR